MVASLDELLAASEDLLLLKLLAALLKALLATAELFILLELLLELLMVSIELISTAKLLLLIESMELSEAGTSGAVTSELIEEVADDWNDEDCTGTASAPVLLATVITLLVWKLAFLEETLFIEDALTLKEEGALPLNFNGTVVEPPQALNILAMEATIKIWHE